MIDRMGDKANAKATMIAAECLVFQGVKVLLRSLKIVKVS